MQGRAGSLQLAFRRRDIGRRIDAADADQAGHLVEGALPPRLCRGRRLVGRAEGGGLLFGRRREAGQQVDLGRRAADRKSVGEGKSVSVRVDLGGRRIIKKKKKTKTN